MTKKQRTTTVPYRYWALHQRIIEKLYRWTHGGRIRTLVIRTRDWSGEDESWR